MRRALVAVVAIVVSVVALTARAEAQRTRAVDQPFRGSIEELVRPDDEIIVLKRSGDVAEQIGHPSVAEAADDLRHEADLILVANVVGLTAHQSKGRSWIDTDISLQVHDFVFWTQQGKDWTSNRRQQFTVAGGEMFVGTVLVKTERTYALKVGGVYLLCLAKAKNGAPVLIWVYPPLRIENSRLVSNRSDFIKAYVDPLGGQSLSKVLTLLRRR